MLPVFLHKLRGIFRRRRQEQDFAEEVEAHLDLLAEEYRRQGMTEAEARVAARRSFGGVAQIQEEHREARVLLHLDRTAADVRYALRGMRRNPGFSLLAMVTLGLGIGVNTTLFTAYNSLVLKPLPIAEPDGVYRFERWFKRPSNGNVQYAFSWNEYAWVRDHGSSYSGVTAASWPTSAFAEADGCAPARVQVQLVPANYFDVLGVSTRRGRGFLPDDDRVSSAPVAVLSDAFARRFSCAAVKLNGKSFTVVGVAGKEFTGTSQSAGVPDVWVPASAMMSDPAATTFQVLGRLRPGTPSRTASAEATLLIGQMAAPKNPDDATIDVTLQHVSFLDNTEDPRFQALVAGVMLLVGAVLLVACANLANLMLARGASRQREIAVRLALGAGRGRVVRQLLTENLLLALGGGVAGLAMALVCSRALWAWAEGLMLQLMPGTVLSLDSRPDWRVFGYALLLAIFAGLLFGMIPALRCTSQIGVGFGRSRLRAVLIGGQVAVSMTLLISAGLLTRGLVRSRVADPGFDTRTLFLLSADYGSDQGRQRRLMERIRTLPEVTAVSEGQAPLLGTWTPPIVAGEIRDRTLASFGDESYLETVGLGLVRGRSFTQREVLAHAPVAVVSEEAARRFWPGGNAIGQRFQLDMDFRGTMAQFEVIGIVKDARLASLSRVDPAHVYVPLKPERQNESFLLRLNRDPRNGVAAIRRAVAVADADLLPSLNLVSIEEGPLWMQKMLAQVMATGTLVLAGLALVLAAGGIYGVMAYLVAQRTREIGIRMALGADGPQVVRDVVVAGLRPVFVGMVVGIAGAAAVSSVLHSTLKFPGSIDFLYGVSFYDPASFGGLSVIVLGLSALASAIPARRASRVDPLAALRHE